MFTSAYQVIYPGISLHQTRHQNRKISRPSSPPTLTFRKIINSGSRLMSVLWSIFEWWNWLKYYILSEAEVALTKCTFQSLRHYSKMSLYTRWRVSNWTRLRRTLDGALSIACITMGSSRSFVRQQITIQMAHAKFSFRSFKRWNWVSTLKRISLRLFGQKQSLLPTGYETGIWFWSSGCFEYIFGTIERKRCFPAHESTHFYWHPTLMSTGQNAMIQEAWLQRSALKSTGHQFHGNQKGRQWSP